MSAEAAKFTCDDDPAKWMLPGHVGCASRSKEGRCLRIDDPRCVHRRKAK